MNDQRIDMLMCLTGIALVILAMRNFHKIKHSEMLTGLLLGLSAFLVMSMIIVEITHTVGAGEFRMSKTAVSIRNGQNSPYLSMEHIHKGQTESEVRLMTNEKDDEGKTKWITVKADETESEEHNNEDSEDNSEN